MIKHTQEQVIEILENMKIEWFNSKSTQFNSIWIELNGINYNKSYKFGYWEYVISCPLKRLNAYITNEENVDNNSTIRDWVNENWDKYKLGYEGE